MDSYDSAQDSRRLFFDQAPDPIFVLESNLLVVAANPAACRLLGWTEDELRGRPFVELVEPTFQAGLAEELSQTENADGRVLRTILVGCQQQGCEISLRVQRDGLSQRLLLFGRTDVPLEAPVDIQRALHNMPACVWFAQFQQGKAQRFRYDDLGLRQFTGQTARQIRHWDDWLQLVHEEDRPRVRSAYDTILRDARSLEEEYRLQSSDGYRWVRETLRSECVESDGIRISGVVTDISARKGAEAAFRHTERFAKLVAESMPSILFVYDLQEQRVLYVNQRIRDILDIDPEELQRAPSGFALRFLHPTDQAMAAELSQAFEQLDDDAIQTATWRMETKDGLWKWFVSRASIFRRDEQGKPVQIVGCAEDITERKEAEQVRRHLTALVESSGDSIFSCTPEGTILSWNSGAQQLFGHASQEAIGQNLCLLLPDDQQQDCAWLLQRVTEHGLLKDHEAIFCDRNGRRIDVSLTMSPVHDEEGRVAWISAIARDITSRKHSERQLRAAKMQLEAIFHAFPDLCFVCDSEYRIRDYKVGRKEILFVPPEAFLGKRFIDVMPQQIGERLQAAAETVHRTGQLVQVEYTLQQLTKTHYYEARLLPILDEQLFVVVRDITDRKEAEMQIRTSERLLRRLFDLQERERQLLAYEIHDGFVQYVIGAQMTLEAFKHAAELSGEAVTLIDRVLEQLRMAIDEGRTMVSELRPIIIDESGIVQAIAYLVSEHESRGDWSISFTHDVQFGRLSPLLESSIFRIVHEALTNSQKHSGADFVEVRLRQSEQRLQLQISDDGIGFDTDRVADDRFGLEGIRQRARLFGGTAVIHSEPGRGTTVQVEFPLVQEDELSG